MNHETQRRLARTFLDAHHESEPLVLPNAWDAASAIVFGEAGFDAVGTSSAGIAASLGYPDGEAVPREEMLAAIERVAGSVSVPVTADVEAGYGETPEAVAETVRLVVDAGAVGVNLEDGTGDPDEPLDDPDRHAAKIRAARSVADEADLPLVVNGRTDVFWLDVGEPERRLERAIERANAYADAGSDCLFVPGVTDEETIAALADGIDGPLNVLGGPGAPSIATLGGCGVARVSVGSGPMRATLGRLGEMAAELRDSGTYGAMEGAVPYADLHALLVEAVERREE